MKHYFIFLLVQILVLVLFGQNIPSIQICKTQTETEALIEQVNSIYVHSKKIPEIPKPKRYSFIKGANKSVKEKSKRLEKITDILRAICKLSGVVHVPKFQEFLAESFDLSSEGDVLKEDSLLLKSSLNSYKSAVPIEQYIESKKRASRASNEPHSTESDSAESMKESWRNSSMNSIFAKKSHSLTRRRGMVLKKHNSKEISEFVSSEKLQTTKERRMSLEASDIFSQMKREMELEMISEEDEGRIPLTESRSSIIAMNLKASPSAIPTNVNSLSVKTVVVLDEWDPQTDNELRVAEGEVVSVYAEVNDDWMLVKKGDSTFGYLPKCILNF